MGPVNISQVDQGELAMIVRHARRLAGSRCCLGLMLRRLARIAHRSPLTILHTLRKFDLDHPDEAILPRVHGDMPADQRSAMVSAWRGERPVIELAREHGVPRSAIYHELLEAQVSRLRRARSSSSTMRCSTSRMPSR